MPYYLGKCAGCGCPIYQHMTTGQSGLYSPQRHYTLCEPCFFAEDTEIETRGNNLPDLIAIYNENQPYEIE